MTPLNLKNISLRALMFILCALIAICLIEGYVITSILAYRAHENKDWTEVHRVTSPDGRLDALMTLEESPGGAIGSFYWNVFIVPKGQGMPANDKTSVFCATDLRGERLVWKQDHHLEIHYDLAEIEEYRNTWAVSQLGKIQGGSKSDYFVEVHLIPNSYFSILNPDGKFNFKRMEQP